MTSFLRNPLAVAAVWLLGIIAGFALSMVLGGDLQCAADADCARTADRWWHLPLVAFVALAPGIWVTLRYTRAARPSAPAPVGVRAVIWAAVGSVLGVALWSLVGSAVWLARFADDPFPRVVQQWPFAVIGTAYWAGFIGLVSFPIYTVLLTGWLAIASRWPALEATRRGRAVSSFGLALPVIGSLIWGFGSSPFGFDWREVSWIAPLAILSAWGALWIPRERLAVLQGHSERRAGTAQAAAAV